MLQIQWAIPEKKGEELLRTYFSENPLEFFIYLLPWKFQTNQFSTPGGNCAKRCYICRKFQDQKPNPWKFNIILSWSPLKIPHSITLMTLEIPYPRPPLPCVCFFSGIAQCRKSRYFFFI